MEPQSRELRQITQREIIKSGEYPSDDLAKILMLDNTAKLLIDDKTLHVFEVQLRGVVVINEVGERAYISYHRISNYEVRF